MVVTDSQGWGLKMNVSARTMRENSRKGTLVGWVDGEHYEHFDAHLRRVCRIVDRGCD